MSICSTGLSDIEFGATLPADLRVRRLPTFVSIKAASAELNQSLRQTYKDLNARKLDSIVDPETRKRHIFGSSVERRAAEKIAAAKKIAAPVAAETARATAASLTERRLNPQKWRKRRMQRARQMANAPTRGASSSP